MLFIVHRMVAKFATVCPCGNAVPAWDYMGFSADWNLYGVRWEACRVAVIERFHMEPHDGMLWSTRETVPEDWTRLTTEAEESCSTSA